MPSDSGGSSRHLVTYADGERIFTQGERGDEMYIIQDGQVEIVLAGDDGTWCRSRRSSAATSSARWRCSRVRRAPPPRAPRAVAAVLPLRGALFVEMLQRDPETTLRIMKKLCSRIRELQDRLSELADGDASLHRRGGPDPGGDVPAPVSTAPGRTTAGVRLVHASGIVLPLADIAEARVGRPDSAVGSVPEIDLTPLNEARTVSRRTPGSCSRDGKLFVVAEAGATNGTFVGGERLEPGVPREMRRRIDSVSFGTVTLTLAIG